MLVDSGYLLASLPRPAELADRLREALVDSNLLGTLTVAREGLNWSMCGAPTELDAFLQEIAGLGLEGQMRRSRTHATTAPFRQLKVRLRPELVTSGVEPDGLPSAAGTHVAPQAFNALVDTPGVRLIDVRNQYEIDIGRFGRAEQPGIECFTDFADYVDSHLDAENHCTPVALYCTGGIRCERAAQLLLDRGFEQVYQLAGGILAYLQAVPEEQQQFHGECFVFDGRVSLTRGLEDGNYQLDGARITAKHHESGASGASGEALGARDCPDSSTGTSAPHTMSRING